MQLPAAEAAQVLDSSVAAVNSCLQRARSTLLGAGVDLDQLREPSDPAARAVVDRYLAAFEAADVDGLARLLTHDVVLEMPPVDLWLQGRDDYRRFMERVFRIRGRGWFVLPVPANGGPALAAYAPDPESPGTVRAHSLQTFDVQQGLIRRSVAFVDPAYFAWFGLPLRTTAPHASHLPGTTR
jgi:RNA polymerase sigma-70 factor (ECF subfamily)